MDFSKHGFFGLYWFSPGPCFSLMDNLGFFFFEFGGKYAFSAEFLRLTRVGDYNLPISVVSPGISGGAER